MDPHDSKICRLAAREILARQIRLLRTLRGWSQETLAGLTDLHRTYIGAIERAEGNPCLNNIEKIARAFEVPVRTLLDERFEDLFDHEINRVEEPRPAYGNGVLPFINLPAHNQHTPSTRFVRRYMDASEL